MRHTVHKKQARFMRNSAKGSPQKDIGLQRELCEGSREVEIIN